jgi:hypothetical protein
MSLTARLRALERHAPCKPNPWATARIYRHVDGETFAIEERTGEVVDLDDLPDGFFLIELPAEVAPLPAGAA